MLKWILKLLAVLLGLGLVFLLLMGNPQLEFEPVWLHQFRLTVGGEYIGQLGHGLWHPHLLVSGANNAEATLPLPGDKLISAPMIQLTRAITIESPAKDLWPWLMQMGYGRGGWYAWSPLGNDEGMGPKLVSVKKIMTEFQQLKVGDILLDSPGCNKHKGAWTVKMFYLNRALVLYSAREISAGREFEVNGPKPANMYFERSWAFILEPIDKTSTRLVLRTRANIGPEQWAQFIRFLFTPGDTARQRSMLDGIKERVEQFGADKESKAAVGQE
ncbi:MAG: hypothetical protein HY920_05155 [Elusimicrobia bacterium]|nr:hypothetical protein [Elusimicrobiota bacterium]